MFVDAPVRVTQEIYRNIFVLPAHDLPDRCTCLGSMHAEDADTHGVQRGGKGASPEKDRAAGGAQAPGPQDGSAVQAQVRESRYMKNIERNPSHHHLFPRPPMTPIG